jgi:alanine-synthesizing transaminase
MFSGRLPPDCAPNALSRRIHALRESGIPYIDLTESNPTRAGFEYPPDLLRSMAHSAALQYEPHPFGLWEAREAVARDHERRGAHIDVGHVVLTASTSEAYSWLFKLLCNPGDRVLVPRPSYPLFEHLTRLENVQAVPYPLEYHGRWEIDLRALDVAASAGARAVLVVSPNNPTGSFLTARELAALDALCGAGGLALIVDEVFADYPLDAGADAVRDVALRTRALTFTLGGLSKSAGLPQVKLGWIVVGGEARRRDEALGALEHVADSFLSVSTPVQVAASDLLARGAAIRAQIHRRVLDNLARLRGEIARHPSCALLTAEGGWYAVIRVPSTRSEEEIVLHLLDRERVLVHPGYFFDFPGEAYLVISLLPPSPAFADAVTRVLAVTS